MKISVVGGTGAFGRALAARLHDLGHDVAIGSRDASRAAELGAVMGIRSGTNEEAVRDADLVVLAVQSSAAVETARELAGAIGETPVLCVASDLLFTREGIFPGRHTGSIAEDVAELVSGPVVSGCQALPAAHLARPDPLDEDALACGDDEASKGMVLELLDGLVSGRTIDAGPLANSRALEGMTAVILHVNKKYRVVSGLRMTGFRD